jgi:signal transduction histidine kinase
VIINLIGNSIKFTLKGEINITYRTIDSNMLEFCIRDTGLGMSEEAKKRIFERFEQADDSIERHFGGSGIGLTISKELVEMHGGRIWVESDLDQGTSFFFTLPYL